MRDQQSDVGELIYPGNAGCAGSRHSEGGSPRACVAEPTGTVAHTYRTGPARLFVCDIHATHGEDPRPLTDDDRAELVRRREWRHRGLAGLPLEPR